MNKFIIMLLVILFCFGCGKAEKNITINIYESNTQEERKNLANDTETKYDNIVEESINKEETGNNIFTEDTVINGIVEQEEIAVKNDVNANENNSSTCEKSTLNKVKDWYNENKEEIKSTNEEIIEEDKRAITNIIDKTKDWYNENKEEVKSTNEEIIEEDKRAITNIIDKTKDWYNENKEEIKSTNEEIIEEDKRAITNIIDKTKDWYNENKEEIKSTNEEIIENDKSLLIDLYNKLKNNE